MPKSDPSGLPVSSVKGVGAKRAALLSSLGIKTVKDLLFHLPVRYEDRGRIQPVSSLVPGQKGTVKAAVARSAVKGTPRARMRIFELVASDGTGRIVCKWFNQPFLKGRFKKGGLYYFSGLVKLNPYERALEMENPYYEKAGEEEAGEGPAPERTAPVYPLTAGLTPRSVRAIIKEAMVTYLGRIEDPVPPDILERAGLPPLKDSIMCVHVPPPGADAGQLNRYQSPCQKRIFFDELFLLALGLALRAKGMEALPALPVKETPLLRKFLAGLPFTLTGAQERAIKEILSDMAQTRPMKRLLQGDVGSGKTAVALAAIAVAAGAGYQAALMAPTEILAGQHYINIHKPLEALGLKTALLTGGVRNRAALLEEIARGETQVIAGTHALISEGVFFKNLALAVIDEQHRFGVLQRAELLKKAAGPEGTSPHLLAMTATPIPRTLLMSVYGDLDTSVLDEMPPGRSPVRTELLYEGEKHLAFEAIEKDIGAGGQVYVVYPAIEGDEDEKAQKNLRSAVEGHEGFMKKFPSARVALLHGRMPPAAREEVMERMRAGEIDILVSTTVIEVGVDVPDATLMVIVHAERFGLSQLHQLRGRVGRGARASKCVLLAYPPVTEDAARRLKAMVRTTDGFLIAEEDLAIRGPGEFLGTKQSGVPELRHADLVRDRELFLVAKKEAFIYVQKGLHEDPPAGLREAFAEFWSGKGLFLAGG